MDKAFVDALGYVAAGAVLATFSTRSIKALRVLAIISNLLFIAYAASAMLLPVLALHALLLPLNVMRLCELLGTACAAPKPPEASAKHANRGVDSCSAHQRWSKTENPREPG